MIERIENDWPTSETAERSASNPIGRFLLFAIILGVIFLGWRYLNPQSAMAKTGWIDDWDHAVEQSRSTGKPALALFTADWCPACRKFESELSNPSLQQYLRENYTLVLVDLSDRSGPNNQRARQMNIRAVPTLILYDTFGREAARGYGMPANALMMWLQSGGKAVQFTSR